MPEKTRFDITPVDGKFKLSETCLKTGIVDTIGFYKTERGVLERRRKETLKRDYPSHFGWRAKDINGFQIVSPS